MDDETKRWMETYKYRDKNNITGRTITINFTDERPDYTSTKAKLRPIGLTIYDNKKYYVVSCPMTWEIVLATDSLDKFEDCAKGFPSKSACVTDSWGVLASIAGCRSFQNWCEIFTDVLLDDLNTITVESSDP